MSDSNAKESELTSLAPSDNNAAAGDTDSQTAPLLADDLTQEEREFLHGTFGAMSPERVLELTAPHSEKIARIFALVDVDGSGKISRDECIYLARLIGRSPAQARKATDNLFRDIDTDKSNTLEQNEWLVFFAVLIDKSQAPEERMDEFLDQLIETLTRDRQPLTWSMVTYRIFLFLSFAAFCQLVALLALTFRYTDSGDWDRIDEAFGSLVDRGAIEKYDWTMRNNTSVRIAACILGLICVMVSPFVSYPRKIDLDDASTADVHKVIHAHWSKRATRFTAAMSLVAVVLQLTSLLMDSSVLLIGVNGCDQACDGSCDPLRPDDFENPTAEANDAFSSCESQSCRCGLLITPRGPEVQSISVFTASADSYPGGRFLMYFLGQPASQELAVTATADDMGNTLGDIDLLSNSAISAGGANTTLEYVYPMDINVTTTDMIEATEDDAARYNVRTWTITFNNAYLDTGPMTFNVENLTVGTYVDVTATPGQAAATFSAAENPFDNQAVYSSGLIGIGAIICHGVCAVLQIFYTCSVGNRAHQVALDRMLNDDKRGLSHKNLEWLSGGGVKQKEGQLPTHSPDSARI